MFAVASTLYLCVWCMLSHNMIMCPFCWSQLWCTHLLGSKPPHLPLPILRMVNCCWGFWLRICFGPSFLRTLQRYQFLVRALEKVAFSSWNYPVLFYFILFFTSVAVIKYSDQKSSIREKGLIWHTIPGYSPLLKEREGWNLKQLVTFPVKGRENKCMHACCVQFHPYM